MGDQERASLEAFVVDNQELEQLESLLAQFNIFEAIGAVQQELRHSDFLAFLLDPSQSHGLGDIFLKRLLKRVLIGHTNPPLSAVEIDVADLHDAVVWREWRHIDILILDPTTKLVCVIENKVGSTEHSDQLRRYRETVQGEFPDHSKVFVYLTPEGDTPSDETYIPFDYRQVAELIDAIRKARESTLGPDVSTLMEHYTAMLGRHIVSESEIAELCQKIYRRHKQALDLIFEHRPDLQWELSGHLTQLIAEGCSHDLVQDHIGKSNIRFALSEWDKVPAQLSGQGWTGSERVLRFEFGNRSDQLRLILVIGPGPDSVRRAIFQTVKKHPQVFRGGRKRLATKWTTAYVRRFLAKRDYEDADLETLIDKVRKQWQQFLNQDLPAIRECIAQVEWPEI
jgi:hypothetical protein